MFTFELRCAAVSPGMKTLNAQEVLPSLISRITVDLSECVDALWAVAMTSFGEGLLPLSTFGIVPSIEECVAYTESALKAQPHAGLFEGSGAAERDCLPQLICPIRTGDSTIAVLAFGPRKPGGAYTLSDRKLMLASARRVCDLMSNDRMASRVASNMAAVERTMLELQGAREVQRRFLPRLLKSVDGLDYYGECQPAGDVGGDFFDFVPVGHSSLLFSIGDVSGKDVPSAIVMAGLQAFMRAIGSRNCAKIATVVQDLNQMICDLSPENIYASMFYGRVDPERGGLAYVNAGHEPALLIRAKTGRVVRLENSGTVLGLSARTRYEQRYVELNTGDLLVAFSDGISDALGVANRGKYEDLVVKAVNEHFSCSSDDLAARLLRMVDGFTGGLARGKDKTVVVIRFVGKAMDLVLRNPMADRFLAQAV